MKAIGLTILLFLASTATVESLFLGGFGVGLLALKGAILGGLALGGALRRRSYHRPRYYRRRYGRSVEDLQDGSVLELADDMIIQADLKDVDDCAKMLVCQVNTRKENMDEMESLILNIFGLNQDGALDVTKPSAQFDFAALAGQKGGLKQCQTLYGRCQMSYEQLLKTMEENIPMQNLGQVPNEI